MTKETDVFKEVLIHAIEQQKVHPDSVTLKKLILYMKRWYKKLGKDALRARAVDNATQTNQTDV